MLAYGRHADRLPMMEVWAYRLNPTEMMKPTTRTAGIIHQAFVSPITLTFVTVLLTVSLITVGLGQQRDKRAVL